MIEFLMDKFVGPVMFGIMILFTVGLILLIPFGIYSWITYKPPEPFELRVDSWQCTSSHLRDLEICSKTCHWITETICDQWTAK